MNAQSPDLSPRFLLDGTLALLTAVLLAASVFHSEITWLLAA